MPTDLEIAYRCAPVIVQKVNSSNPRGDFIARVDFTEEGNLASLTRNWAAVNDPVKDKAEWKKILKKEQAPSFTHKLLPHVYYSVVETHTHYFIMYAVYHPQDWESSDTPWRSEGPKWKATEHEHDMEGALVIAGKRGPLEKLRPDAMITISHWWFYSYANWKLKNKAEKEVLVFDNPTENRFRGSRVNKEDLDGNLWAVWHVDEGGEQIMRPRLYVQAKGHGIRGDKRDWGRGDREIRYCPSLKEADEPSFFGGVRPDPAIQLLYKDSLKDRGGWHAEEKRELCRYKLINILEPTTGLWANKDDRKVFLVNDDKGQDCFVAHESPGGALEPGSAKPPWSWDDCDDAHADGELALQPAHIVYNYLGGIREFSFEYVRNPYLGI
jgi:hypothetical protein